MLANPTREVRIDQFTDFAHDFHPQRLDVEQRLACLIPEGGFSVCDRNHGCALSGARQPAGFAFFPRSLSGSLLKIQLTPGRSQGVRSSVILMRRRLKSR
jgi:hypothetical protein